MDGFKKIQQSGGTYVTATFYNPDTKETKMVRVRDYDYTDCSRDNDELYYMPIDEEARRQFYHNNGVILAGDKARVIKGRTLPRGYVGEVKEIREMRDRYGRWVADYAYFTDGNRINVKNCELVN